MATVLSISELTFGYPGCPTILNRLSLQLGAGEKVGLIGPNGAGKTTLFLLICGILKPVAGSIEVCGNRVKPGSFNPRVGMVFQHTGDQLICPSVREDIAFGPQNMGLDIEEVKRRTAAAAEATGVVALLDRPPHQLSCGEQRLVALSGVLSMQPSLIILDEPTADLDLRYRRRLIGLLGEMTGQTILIASHDLEFILETCGRVLLLDGGSFKGDGLPAEVMSDRKLMENHGLEVPHSLQTN